MYSSSTVLQHLIILTGTWSNVNRIFVKVRLVSHIYTNLCAFRPMFGFFSTMPPSYSPPPPTHTHTSLCPPPLPHVTFSRNSVLVFAWPRALSENRAATIPNINTFSWASTCGYYCVLLVVLAEGCRCHRMSHSLFAPFERFSALYGVCMTVTKQ